MNPQPNPHGNPAPRSPGYRVLGTHTLWICAWHLDPPPDVLEARARISFPEPDQIRVTHGICADCKHRLLSHNPQGSPHP